MVYAHPLRIEEKSGGGWGESSPAATFPDVTPLKLGDLQSIKIPVERTREWSTIPKTLTKPLSGGTVSEMEMWTFVLPIHLLKLSVKLAIL
jgi:hypothetical protein